MTIWKFPLVVDDMQEILMPDRAEVLAVQVQNDRPCIWALVDEKLHPTARRVFVTIGTGHPIPYPMATLKYVGTYQIAEGALVFHVFEKL